jgi:DNA polymerase sigma
MKIAIAIYNFTTSIEITTSEHASQEELFFKIRRIWRRLRKTWTT